MKNASKILGLTLTIVGTVFLLVSSAFFINIGYIKKNYYPIEAYIVTNNHDREEIYIAFDTTISGIPIYQSYYRLDYYTSLKSTGDIITVYMDPTDFTNITYINYLLPIIFLTLSLCFLPIGVFLNIKYLKSQKLRNQLLRNNKYIYAKITKVTFIKYFRINGINPLRITCVYRDDIYDREFTFVSGGYFPKNLEEYQSKLVKVYVMNKKTYAPYYVALEEGIYNNKK